MELFRLALLTIKSTNPQFSFILSKNPSSGLLVKSCRLGHLYGWFSLNNSQEYYIWFRDSDTEVSYKENPDDQFEYLDISRYNSPMFPANAITEMLGSASKKRHEQDSLGYDNELIINEFYILCI